MHYKRVWNLLTPTILFEPATICGRMYFGDNYVAGSWLFSFKKGKKGLGCPSHKWNLPYRGKPVGSAYLLSLHWCSKTGWIPVQVILPQWTMVCEPPRSQLIIKCEIMELKVYSVYIYKYLFISLYLKIISFEMFERFSLLYWGIVTGFFWSNCEDCNPLLAEIEQSLRAPFAAPERSPVVHPPHQGGTRLGGPV